MSWPGLTGPFREKIGSRAFNSKKRAHQDLKISRNVRVPSRQFRNKSASGAEDFKKCSGSEPAIPKKERIRC
jgi:hypothetical protein